MTGITLAGEDVTLEGRENESVCDTLLRAGYTMRLACRRGGCGLCRVHIDSGETVYKAPVADAALPMAERELGIVLGCRAVPTCDITISVPADENLRCIVPLITPFALRQPAPTGDRSSCPKDGATG